MLSYAFQTLNQSNYEEIAAEKFQPDLITMNG